MVEWLFFVIGGIIGWWTGLLVETYISHKEIKTWKKMN
jgi:hypothetical protein